MPDLADKPKEPPDGVHISGLHSFDSGGQAFEVHVPSLKLENQSEIPFSYVRLPSRQAEGKPLEVAPTREEVHFDHNADHHTSSEPPYTTYTDSAILICLLAVTLSSSHLPRIKKTSHNYRTSTLISILLCLFAQIGIAENCFDDFKLPRQVIQPSGLSSYTSITGFDTTIFVGGGITDEDSPLIGTGGGVTSV